MGYRKLAEEGEEGGESGDHNNEPKPIYNRLYFTMKKIFLIFNLGIKLIISITELNSIT